MTVATATNFTTNRTIDQGILDDLDFEFAGFRGRIADMSIDASVTLTSMFGTLGPVDGEIIDIKAIEFEQFTLELVPAGAVEELAAA